MPSGGVSALRRDLHAEIDAALAAWLAGRERSQGLAFLAVGGGFLTPFLIGGETGSQTALLGYDAILVAGIAYLAHRRDWPLLNLIS